MRRRRLLRKESVIDMTSLLDVVFLLLVLTIGMLTQTTNTVNQKAESSESELVRATKDEYDTLENCLSIATVTSSITSEDYRDREIHIMYSGVEETTNCEIHGNIGSELEDLKTYLVQYIESNEGRVVILSLNEEDEKILYRDEQQVLKIFGELDNQYDNVYIKSSLKEKKKE